MGFQATASIQQIGTHVHYCIIIRFHAKDSDACCDYIIDNFSGKVPYFAVQCSRDVSLAYCCNDHTIKEYRDSLFLRVTRRTPFSIKAF